MDDVRVHYNSDKPAQLQAHAYAQGAEIHLASGQEKYLPHEAWHVVQQKQGRVKATVQAKGSAPVNDDGGLENEADVMGAKALRISSNRIGDLDKPLQRNATVSQSNVVQKYGDLPRLQLQQWVNEHLLNPGSQFTVSSKWLMAQSKRDAQTKKLGWERELTEKKWETPNVSATGEDSDLSQMRARFEIKSLDSSKYTIVADQSVNLNDTEEVDPDDVPSVAAESVSSGVLVSAPLYACITGFPANYVQGAEDEEKFSFILAYNAHGLTKTARPVEDAVARDEINGSRGVALGFYWEQKLFDKVYKKDVWTNDAPFITELNEKASDEGEKAAFAKSLRHKKVLGTFPYGMWRNIAMNYASVNEVMDSPWGVSHAPVMAHVTDPDAETWVDPFTNVHVADSMSAGAQQTGAQVVKGSYIYASGGPAQEGDSDEVLWDKHVKNIAHTSSILDALLRPALVDKVGLSYPAERNLMIELKNTTDAASLYKKQAWRAKTQMNLTIEQTNDYNGANTVFGLGDNEGQELEKSVTSVMGGARSIVTNAAVTTEVPARVKSSVALESYSNHKQSADTGDLKTASNVKESLQANDTTEMMARAASTFSPGKKLAYSEFRDRPRRLWAAINKAKNTMGASPESVTDSIDRQVDSWRSLKDGEALYNAFLGRLLKAGKDFLKLKDDFISILKINFATYNHYNADLGPYQTRVLQEVKVYLSHEIENMEGLRREYADITAQLADDLERYRSDEQETAEIVKSLREHNSYFTDVAKDQLEIFQDILANIHRTIG